MSFLRFSNICSVNEKNEDVRCKKTSAMIEHVEKA